MNKNVLNKTINDYRFFGAENIHTINLFKQFFFVVDDFIVIKLSTTKKKQSPIDSPVCLINFPFHFNSFGQLKVEQMNE
mgnify:CR=1 FL=1